MVKLSGSCTDIVQARIAPATLMACSNSDRFKPRTPVETTAELRHAQLPSAQQSPDDKRGFCNLPVS